ncbi:hypothetical protein F4802DRAFT_189774 [Xylaria palmicola]|nr:hypothetical protein F4802DRAFT_189774 [Xylaria palmicola]
MESLRAQLAETQGALTERDKKFRQLRADATEAAKLWMDQKAALEARIAGLESENLRLKGQDGASPAPAAAGLPTTPTPPTPGAAGSPDAVPTPKSTEGALGLGAIQNAGGGDKITITREQMKQVEARFEQMTMKLAQSSLVPVLELTDSQVVMRWNQLREKIRALTLEHLNKTFSATLVTGKSKDEFKMLSPHWKTYTSTENMTCYLFRALIWRYLLRYFEIYCRACGRDVSNKVGAVATALIKSLPDSEYQDWRIRTATLIHDVHPIDKSYVDELTDKIMEAITPLAADANVSAVRTSLRDVVHTTAELSAAFDRAHFLVLMSDVPGSSLTHGFPYVENLMDISAKLGSQGVVDLMVAPSLVKKGAEYSVLVKAEVIC